MFGNPNENSTDNLLQINLNAFLVTYNKSLFENGRKYDILRPIIKK